jgi:hypothetical protein
MQLSEWINTKVLFQKLKTFRSLLNNKSKDTKLSDKTGNKELNNTIKKHTKEGI